MPETELTLYDGARRALAEASRVDEVKGIRDKAVAMQVYAQQAKDGTLIAHATEIRMRAELRAGELLAAMEKNKGAVGGGKKPSPRGPITEPRDTTPKLADLGVTKKQSSNWQRLAALPKSDQEAKIALAKDRAEAAVQSVRDKPPDRKPKPPERVASKVIGTLDRCAMRVRELVLAALQELPPSEWAELLSSLRDELDDIEKVSEKRRSDGHHPARQPA